MAAGIMRRKTELSHHHMLNWPGLFCHPMRCGWLRLRDCAASYRAADGKLDLDSDLASLLVHKRGGHWGRGLALATTHEETARPLCVCALQRPIFKRRENETDR